MNSLASFPQRLTRLLRSPESPGVQRPSQPPVEKNKPQDSVLLSPTADPKSAGQDSRRTPEQEFRETFFSEYAARFCGRNIQRFVTRLSPEDAAQANVLSIRNQGGSWFGYVRALQARDAKGAGELFVNDRNWEFHVVLEHQGKIYDFDYGIEPKCVGVEEYFHDMYLSGDEYVKPERKLDGYSIQVTPALEYDGSPNPANQKKMSEYLAGWGVNLEKYGWTDAPTKLASG